MTHLTCNLCELRFDTEDVEQYYVLDRIYSETGGRRESTMTICSVCNVYLEQIQGKVRRRND